MSKMEEWGVEITHDQFSKKTNGSETIFALHTENGKIELSLIGANKGVKGLVFRRKYWLSSCSNLLDL